MPRENRHGGGRLTILTSERPSEPEVKSITSPGWSCTPPAAPEAGRGALAPCPSPRRCATALRPRAAASALAIWRWRAAAGAHGGTGVTRLNLLPGRQFTTPTRRRQFTFLAPLLALQAGGGAPASRTAAWTPTR